MELCPEAKWPFIVVQCKDDANKGVQDKETFTKEMEESKSHLMNTVTKSLSNQETKMMNSL